ncbi:MAG: hypothetical protein ACI9Y1_000855 [Lentisphaeria bacterium]|jgi:uncharacterized protein YbaP (TraB family)
MKRSITSSLLAILCFSIGLSANAESPAWKISSGDNHQFLAATIHMLAPDDYPLPTAFAESYQGSAAIIMETDTKALQAPAFQMATLKAMTINDGTTLEQAI